jgi:hypothetical protein
MFGIMRKIWILSIIVAIIVILTLVTYPSIYSSKPQLGKFFKVSDKDYAPPGKVVIWFITWVGCPVGASDSWILYGYFKANGINVNLTFHYTNPNDRVGPLPGILFVNGIPTTCVPYNYSSQNVLFSVCYLMNEYFNATPNGIPVPPNEILNTEISEMRQVLPQWVYNLVYYYNVKEPFNINGKSIPPAEYVFPHHIISTIIISGKGGTWMIIGPMYNITALKGLTYDYVLQHLYEFSWYNSSYQELSQIISLAEG